MCLDDEPHSHSVIRAAIMSALASIVRMAKDRRNQYNTEYVDKLQEIWKVAIRKYKQSVIENHPDFTIIQQAEANMRKYYLALIWIRGHQLGYKEERRVYNESEGKVGPLNRSMSIGGAEMRDFCLIYYPLPNANQFQSLSEKIKISHNKLPSLDFAEVLRCHMIELSFTLCIYGVPFKEMSKYFQSLFYDCKPILDWIYAGGRRGINSRRTTLEKPTIAIPGYHIAKHNPRDMDTVLSKHKKLIQHEFGTLGRKHSLTSIIDLEDDRNENRIKTRSYEDFPEEKKRTTFLQEMGISLEYNKYITSQAIEDLIEQTRIKVKYLGTRYHDFLLNGFPQPYSIDNFLNNPDKFESIWKNVYILAELDLSNGFTNARADLLVCIKIKNSIWPILLLDLKTRYQLLMDFFGKNTGSRIRKESKEEHITPKFTIAKDILNPDCWRFFYRTTPSSRESKQIEGYARQVMQFFKEFYPNEKEKYNRFKPITGILRIQSQPKTDDTINLQQVLNSLIPIALQKIPQWSTTSDRSFIASDGTLEVALHLNQNQDLIPSSKLVQQFKFFNLQNKSLQTRPILADETREGITALYLYHEHQGPSGKSAAFIATIHHLIPYVVREHPNDRIAIVDLLSMFDRFQDCRLRVNKKLRRYLSKIDIISWEDFVYTHAIPEIDDYDTYILLGWDYFKKISHSLDSASTEQLERDLIAAFPDPSNLYLVDRATKGEMTSRRHQSRTLKNPVASYRRDYISSVIFNLPTAPKTINHNIPRFEEQRVIVEWSNIKIRTSIVPIIPLRRYSERFSRSNTKNLVLPVERIKRSDRELQVREIEYTMELLSWLSSKPPDHLRFDLDQDIEFDTITETRFDWEYPWPNNLIYQERKTIPRNRLHKSFINQPYRRFYQQRFSYIEIIETIQPLNPALLSPKLNSQDDRHHDERRRIMSMIHFIQNNVTVDDQNNKNKRGRLSDDNKIALTTLFEKIAEATDLSQIKSVIQSWDEKHQILLWPIFRKEAETLYQSYIHSEIGQEIDPEFFQSYGLSNYILLLTLDILYPGMDRLQLIKVLKRLHSHTLQLLGFFPIRPDLPKTMYQTSLIFYSTQQFFTYHTRKPRLMKEIGKNGWIFIMKKYTWIDFPGYRPVLVENDRHFVFFDSFFHSYSTVIDEEIINEEIDDLERNLTTFPTSKFPIIIQSKENTKYLWVKQNEIWICIGQLYLVTMRTLDGKKAISSFSLTKIKDQYMRYEGDLSEFDLVSKFDHYKSIHSTQILYPKLWVNEHDLSEIGIEYYSKGEEKPVITEVFNRTNDLIDRLRKIRSGVIRINYSELDFRIAGEIDWCFSGQNEWDLACLKPYVLARKRTRMELPDYVCDLLDHIEDDTSIKVEFTITHNSTNCEACNVSLKQAYLQYTQYTTDFQAWKTSANKITHDFSRNNKLYSLRITSKHDKLSRSIKEFQTNLSSQEIFYKFSKPYYSENGDLYEPVISELQHEEFELTEENFFIAEDYWLRRLAKERYGVPIRSRAPGLETMRDIWILQSINIRGISIEVNYHNPHRRKPEKTEISGHVNDCFRIEYWRTGLEKAIKDVNLGEESTKMVFESNKSYRNIMEIIKNHLENCSNHEFLLRESTDPDFPVEYHSIELNDNFIEMRVIDPESGQYEVDNKLIWQIGQDPFSAFNHISDTLLKYFENPSIYADLGQFIVNQFDDSVKLIDEEIVREDIFNTIIDILEELDDQMQENLDETIKKEVYEANQKNLKVLNEKFDKMRESED